MGSCSVAALLKLKPEARATRHFIGLLDPEREFWVLGFVTRWGLWMWETFHGSQRGPQAEQWIAARYAEDAEVWMLLGDVAAPVRGYSIPTDAVTGCRFVAAVGGHADPFLSRAAGYPLTIFRDRINRAVAVWKLDEALSQTEAVYEAGRRAASCCTARWAIRPQLHSIPLPGDIKPSGLLGSIVRRPIHGRTQARFDAAPLMLTAAGGSPEAPALLEAPAVDASTCDQSVSLADVQAAPIDWLWPGRLARKKLHLIGGDPGVGKSQFCAFLAARVTAGGAWPCGEGVAPGGGGVLWFGSEEDPAEEILPRVLAAGADRRRIRCLRPGWRIVGGIAELDREWALVGGAQLLILDPINAAVGSGAGTNDRLREAALSPLLAWAARRNVAVLGVLHPPKSGGVTPATMFGSFKAYREVARIVLYAAADDGRSLLLLDKGNALSPEEKRAHAYRIEGVELSSGITAPRIAFEDLRFDITAETWLAGQPPLKTIEVDDEEDEDAGAKDRAIAALCRLLPAGESRPAPEIKREMTAQGFSKGTIEEAATALGVQREDGPGRAKIWSR